MIYQRFGVFAAAAVMAWCCVSSTQAQVRLGGGQAAPALDTVIKGVTPGQLATLLTQVGYSAGPVSELSTRNQFGTQKLAKFTNGSREVSIYMLGCDEGQLCQALMFEYKLPRSMDLTAVNAFNLRERYGHLVRADDGAVYLRADYSLRFGVVANNMPAQGSIFQSIMDRL